jgi:hypothetical protein
VTPREKALKLIDDRIDTWHNGSSEASLHEWLGWTESEYTVFAESSEPPAREIALHEVVEMVTESKVREADVSDGSKVKWGHNKHVKDLRKRIDDLTAWRDKRAKGSETRAEYSRLIQRLKGELKSAVAAAEKKKKKTQRPKR